MSPDFAVAPALQAAGFIGFWNTDVAAALSILDEGAAEILSGNLSLAGQPIPLDVALSRLHPEDRGWVFEQISRVRSTGGPVSLEFRILTTSGKVRWVLNRGSLAPDEAGTMRGRGVYIDTTDSHAAPFLPNERDEIPASDPPIVAAERSLEAHSAILQTGRETLRLLSDQLLFEIGHLLTRRMR